MYFAGVCLCIFLPFQESLSLSVSKHEQELQDIMETIPTEAYNDSVNVQLKNFKTSLNSNFTSAICYEIFKFTVTTYANKYLVRIDLIRNIFY